MKMGRFLQRPKSSHKKQISIESKVEQTVEEEDMAGRLSPQISVTISRGNDVGSELDLWPRPSTSRLDPLNWPKWRTVLAYTSFLLLTSTSSTLKLLLAPLNAVLSAGLNISYLATVSLTGIPIIVGAFTALGSSILARIVGRRMMLVGGAMFMLVGTVWNMHVASKYANLLAARVFQGIGWGIVEGVIGDAVGDLFFNHQRPLHNNIFNLTTTFFTWSTPILSGYVFSADLDWRNLILSIIIAQTISLVLLIFFTPETQFDRSSFPESALPSPTLPPGSLNSLQTTISSTNKLPPTTSLFKSYLHTLRFPSPISALPRGLLLPIKALGAPSTILRALLTAPLTASTFGIAQFVALLFSMAPTYLTPERIGYLFILPVSFAMLLHSYLTATSYFSSQALNRNKTPVVLQAASSILIGACGILTLGIYTCGKLSPQIVRTATGAFGGVEDGGMMNESRLWVFGSLFGGAVAGSVGVKFVGNGSLGFRKGSEEDREIETEVTTLVSTATSFYTSLLSGIFVLAFPTWISSQSRSLPSATLNLTPTTEEPKELGMGMLMGLQMTSVGLAVVVLVVGGAAAVGVVFGGDGIGRRDLAVLGLKGNGKEQDDDDIA